MTTDKRQGGGSSASRSSCLAKELYSWNNYSDCKNNDWLLNTSTTQWTMSPRADYSNSVFTVPNTGFVVSYSAHTTFAVRPVVHLKSTIKITGGTGSSTDPFILG